MNCLFVSWFHFYQVLCLLKLIFKSSLYSKEISPLSARVVHIPRLVLSLLTLFVVFFPRESFTFLIVKCISFFFSGIWILYSSLQDYDNIHWRFDLVLWWYFFISKSLLHLEFGGSACFSQMGCQVAQHHLFATRRIMSFIVNALLVRLTLACDGRPRLPPATPFSPGHRG